jgi:radical SAM protein with 4Fe4S-binding SPASM domain
MPDSRTIPSIEYKDFSRELHERADQYDRVIKAQLELTYRCNLHCVHCYTDPYNSREFFPKELSLEEIKRILDEMADLGILYLNLTGGEIFTHPHFFEIYDCAYRKGFLLMLYTNGTIFTQAIIDRLKQAPPFSIDISCHSVNEAAFDRFTQVPGSFRQFMKGMELLRSSGLPICFKTKAMNWNKDELSQIKAFIESFGRRFEFTTRLSPRLNGDLSSFDHRLTPEEIAVLEKQARPEDRGADICSDTSDWTPAQPSERLYRCGCATNTIHISAWGELGTCTLQYEHRASLREYSLKEAIRKVFAEIRARRYRTDSPCRPCSLFAFCSKTPTDARWECGDPESPIPYDCDVALTRAEREFGQTLIHPLAIAHNMGGSRHE